MNNRSDNKSVLSVTKQSESKLSNTKLSMSHEPQEFDESALNQTRFVKKSTRVYRTNLSNYES